MSSQTPDIESIPARPGQDPLDAVQIERLRQGTLTILDEIGVHVPSARAREVFASHGARVGDDEVVRLAPDLVLKAMATAPRSFVLAGREERLDLVLDGTRCYISTEGVGTKVADPVTGEVRSSRKDDVALMARICDALPLLSFFWPPVSAQDHLRTAPLHECHAGLGNTRKHVRGATTVYPQLAKYVVEMATVVAGSDAERRRRPPICGNICTISPLAHDAHGLECALTYAEAGIPFSFMAMPTMGSTAPATELGAIVMADAEVVSGMVLVQLACPGAPVFHSFYVSLMDPLSGGYLSETEGAAERIAVQLAHAWGVPSLGGGSVSSDAEGPGWQSGAQTGIGAVTVPLFAAEICGSAGLEYGSTILYPDKVIRDLEVIRHAAAVVGPTEFREEDLALDVIRAVGPRGHFMGQRHTREHLRDHRLPVWLTHDGREAAAAMRRGGGPAAGLEPARAAAIAEFRRLEREHHPEPLAADVQRELDAVVAAADREAEKLG
jgi:trimethylamine:corrinoid methyltransferase-like protein